MLFSFSLHLFLHRLSYCPCSPWMVSWPRKRVFIYYMLCYYIITIISDRASFSSVIRNIYIIWNTHTHILYNKGIGGHVWYLSFRGSQFTLKVKIILSLFPNELLKTNIYSDSKTVILTSSLRFTDPSFFEPSKALSYTKGLILPFKISQWRSWNRELI